ncbi:MAG TPA: dihydrofolate reductase [Bacteroidia bacterium]|jgi:dihydrofolate reductase|nr:dihydrofolate reductase [Bacteroidia bacterium]HQF28807.1 dihydrofolate reductase [Bacteroidia bacterium]HQK97655.1 dihydrofolate reductase [Bacteroidia bacterium]
MILSLIAAMAKHNVIGNNNSLIWHLPADLKHFKSITSGHTVIMGRKTYESIGKALPNRRNIVITRSEDFTAEGCEIFYSLQDAVDACLNEEEVFIIGGAEIYNQSLHAADKLYITRIYQEFEGDAHFPDFSLSEWRLISYYRHHADEKNMFEYSFSEYERIGF